MTESLRTRFFRTAAVAAVAAVALIPAGLHAQTLTTADMAELRPRSIGPAVTGGRVHDVEAVPSDPSIMYVAAASGGLWKSTNRGHTWTNLTDTMAVSTFGDVALAPSDPNIVYAGTGEQQNRQSSSYGNGVYRSDDGGATWRHLGLENTRHIGRIRVHPTNPDIAYVAALGNLWAGSADRGVYRTRDGGRSWDKVLYVDQFTGAVDLVMDARNPDILYAATYQRLRRAWGFNGGGPGSGIHKTTDGGQTWTELTNGIPGADKGRIGLAISRSNPRVLNALIEFADRDQTGTYRSEDGGGSWERVNEMDIRPMYYSHIFIDPNDEDVVYTLATRSFVSEDGGRTFEAIAPAPTYDVGVHADHHTLWIDPNDSNHLFLAGDAGLHETYDRGRNFRKINNFPIAQMYAIGVDMREPYNVFVGLQDNHSFMGPSQTRRWIGIVNDDWKQNGFGDGMHWQADPRPGARYTYGSSNGGNYFRYDFYTGDMMDISPEPMPGEEGYRFDWTSPMLLSEHDPDVLYVAGNRFLISPDNGESWTASDDLSRQVDRDLLEIMGVRGSDITVSRNDGTSSFGEAVTIDESSLDARVLWVGFDDGNLQVTRDRGRTWTEVSRNVRGIADGTYVSRITASLSAVGTAYAAFDGHRDGDFRPFLFRTEDFGRTWTPLHAGLPAMGVVNDVIEHPDNPDILFVGTEHHVFASSDRGRTWAKAPGLPTTHYDDILIHPREKDLVLGTHGRGVWIIDDVGPLAEWPRAVGSAHLFSIAPATMMIYRKDTSYRGQSEFHGQNPPDGALITYKLGAGTGPATLRITAPNGQVVRTMTVPSSPGTHRINWDLRHPMNPDSDEWVLWDNPELARPTTTRGPWVSPGAYTVTLQARGASSTKTVRVQGDPEMPISVAQYQARERFMLDLMDLQAEIRAQMEARGISGGGGGFFGGGSPDLSTVEGKLQTASRTAGSVFSSMSGGGVRGGTLLPPTQTMRDRVAAARALLREVMEM